MRTALKSRRAAVRAALLHSVAASVGAVVSLAAVHAGDARGGTPAAEQRAAHEERLEIVTASGVHALDVEVASTPEKQALGLMYRTSLSDTKGMLFPYPEPRELSMWMHNTYIPLDMVFIRADGTVHRIETRAEPLSDRVIGSNGPVLAVLEIAGGNAERLGLKPGDKVRHPVFGLPPAR